MLSSIKPPRGDSGKFRSHDLKQINTRAEIIKKLERINYISINSKTQIITPTIKRRKNI